MKTTKGILGALLLGIIAMTGSAFAEEITATKTAPGLASLFPEAYGRVETRNYYLIRPEAPTSNTVQNRTMIWQVRPVIGSKFFEGKAGAELYLKVNRTPGSNALTEGRREVYAWFDVVSTDMGGVTPYADILLPGKSSQQVYAGTNGSVGIDSYLTPSMETKVGSLSGLFLAEFSMDVNSRGTDRSVEKDNPERTAESYGLVGDDKDDGTVSQTNAETDPTYYSEYIAGVTYKPSFWKKWSVSLQGIMDTTYEPRHTMVDNEMETSYPSKTTTYEILTLGYKASDKLSFSNGLRKYHGGVWEETGVQEANMNERYENRFIMTYSM